MNKHWIEHMTEIAADFEHADVQQFLFKRIKGKITCTVVVRNADNDLVAWELVDDGVSSDRWRKVSTCKASAPLGTSGLFVGPKELNVPCSDKLLFELLKKGLKL